MKPYYEENGIVIYHGDCREVLPSLPAVDILLTDPPYGVNTRTNYKSSGRNKISDGKDYPKVHGDDEGFEPRSLLQSGEKIILWGANFYADKLPISSKWLIWDKRDGMTSDDNADCEMAWTNLSGQTRLFRHLWRGYFRATEKRDRWHPTQKPITLMKWCIEQAQSAGLILDPFMGSGTTLRAAKDLGRQAIGIEIEERYCEIAANRLRQEVLSFENEKSDFLKPLVSSPSAKLLSLSW